MRPFRLTITAAVLSAVVLAATTGCGPKANDPAQVAALLGPWRMESYLGDGQLKPLLPGTEVTAEFGTDLVSGTDGVNPWTGSYRVDGAKIRFSTLKAETAATGGPDETAQAAALLEDLAKTRAFSVEAGRLTLQDKDGATLLTFVTGEEGDIVGAWTCTGYLAGGDDLTAPSEPGKFTLDIGDGGSVSGVTPAGPFVGAYELPDAAGTLALTDLEYLSEAPETGPGADASGEFLNALAAATSYELGAGSLTLKRADGSVSATFDTAE